MLNRMKWLAVFTILFCWSEVNGYVKNIYETKEENKALFNFKILTQAQRIEFANHIKFAKSGFNNASNITKLTVSFRSVKILKLLDKYYSHSNIKTFLRNLDEVDDKILLSNLDDILIANFTTLNTEISALKATFKANPGTIKAWETLVNHPILRKDPSILAKASSVIQKGHISTADITEILRVNAGLGNRAEAVSKLLDDLDNFAVYRDANGFGAIISGLKADWFNGAGADGANWVISILKKEGTGVFPAPPITNFEVQSALGSVRRYDAVVSQAGQPKKFFEFKSYSSVPPTDFNTQFINDLKNPDISDLSQLKWLFDAAKNPANFDTGMKAAINNLDFIDVPIEVLQKFNVASKPALKAKIINEFESIFFLK